MLAARRELSLKGVCWPQGPVAPPADAASTVPDPRARVDLIERLTLHVQNLASVQC
jgi:hypothetical protein